jgi:hypothetical protein
MIASIANILRWSRLRSLGNLTIVRLTILIPFIGYFVLFNDKLSKYLILSEEIFGIPNSLVSWRTIFFYFGLCVVAIGSAVYQLRCPAIIKQFSDEPHYVAATLPHSGELTLRAIDAEIVGADEQSRDQLSKIKALFDQRHGQIRLMDASPHQEYEYERRLLEDHNKDLLALNYDRLDRSRPVCRAISFAAYGVGFLILSAPTGDVFVRVGCVAVRMFGRWIGA